ncbi:hypothetical protein BDN70DRAFT_991248 [Pholiota conissans]|uniref:Uncharacterized protein n=1 Tax=Pholiota conissans TaxID=109636 RepID=A0A9P5Z807_9AGAR|nr:hypothetical protein BDN70DRAFT_991248 [Pholiota conissans]
MPSLVSSPIATALSSYDKTAVLEAIKANPTWQTIEELGDTFVELAKEKPYESQRLASILAELEHDPEVPFIKTLDFNRQPVEKPYSQIVTAIVFDLLKWVFTDEPSTIEPANSYLAAALISGACVRTGLCNSAVQSGQITTGLRMEGTKWQETIPDELAEVNAVHAVLHLLAGGSRIIREEQIKFCQSELLPALKALAEQNVIVHPEGIILLGNPPFLRNPGFPQTLIGKPSSSGKPSRVLPHFRINGMSRRYGVLVERATIAEAESGFQKDLPLADIWAILFP